MRTGWAVRSANGRATRTAHLPTVGGRAACGWSHTGSWVPAHPFARRCAKCEQKEKA